MRQALAAVGRVCGQTAPAAFVELLIRLFEARRRVDTAIGVTGATDLVAGEIERLEHSFGEFGAFGQNCADQIGRRLAETRQRAILLNLQDFIQNEQGVAHRRLVTRHRIAPV